MPVTITVTDKESGKPIVAATISIEDLIRQTDGNGLVQLQIAPGSYSFRVTSESHQNASGTFEAAAGANTEQHVELEKEAEWIPPPESDQPTLRKGDDSADGWVEYMQSLLNHQFGEDVVPHNGKFDSETEKWVIKFQKREKLAVDGIVGNQTWAALREAKPQKPGTDERTPHSYEEKGAEGRWMTEDASFVQYAESTDELVMAVMSVGDVAIDKFEATMRVTANGSATRLRSSSGRHSLNRTAATLMRTGFGFLASERLMGLARTTLRRIFRRNLAATNGKGTLKSPTVRRLRQ